MRETVQRVTRVKLVHVGIFSYTKKIGGDSTKGNNLETIMRAEPAMASTFQVRSSLNSCLNLKRWFCRVSTSCAAFFIRVCFVGC